MTKKGISAPRLGEVCAEISELTGVEVDADLSTKRQEILDGRTAAHEAAKDVATSMAEARRRVRAFALLLCVAIAQDAEKESAGGFSALRRRHYRSVGRTKWDRYRLIGTMILRGLVFEQDVFTTPLTALEDEALLHLEPERWEKKQARLAKKPELTKAEAPTFKNAGAEAAHHRSLARKRTRDWYLQQAPWKPTTQRQQAWMWYGVDARHGIASLPKDRIQAIITSIPYWGHRTYHDDEGGQIEWADGWVGPLGMEPTLDQYLAHVVEVFEHAKKCLRDDGTLWLDIGDKTTGGGGGYARSGGKKRGTAVDEPDLGLPDGVVLGLPWRVAQALMEAGWVLRSEITWKLLNPPALGSRNHGPQRVCKRLYRFSKGETRPKYRPDAVLDPTHSGEGRRLGDFWEIGWADEGSTANKLDHMAMFPVELARRCILLSTDENDWVLDPFMGSGTTALAALRYSRRIWGFDLQESYRSDVEKKLAEFPTRTVYWLPNEARLRPGNGKAKKTAAALGGKIMSFDLPALASASGFLICPFAGSCRRNCFARDGHDTAKWQHEANFHAIRRAGQQAAARGQSPEHGIYEHLSEMFKRHVVEHNDNPKTRSKIVAIRLHNSGDFYSPEYLRAWLRLMRENPEIIFYAYTKSVSMVHAEHIPTNFRVVFSEGGKQDHLIPADAPRSRIFAPDEYDAMVEAGWADGSGPDGDFLVIQGHEFIGLKWHGRSANVKFTESDRARLRKVHEANDRFMLEATVGPLAAK
jgi:DNA modification methylase